MAFWSRNAALHQRFPLWELDLGPVNLMANGRANYYRNNAERAQDAWEGFAGVFNALNRHNPSMLAYDAESKTWNLVSLFPIMPSVKYTLEIN